MNGLKKSANNRGSQWHSQSAHSAHKVTLRENVGSLDAPRTAHLFTIYKSAKGPQVGRSTTGWVLMWNGDSGADTWCPAMEPMSQIMFYNHLATFGTIYKSAKGPQVGRFHNGMGPDVERGQWCGHMVSGHGTNVSNHVL